MANKIRQNMEWYMEHASESQDRWKEANDHLNELSDLVFKMWQNDLISDKVKSDCFKVIEDIGWQMMKLHPSNNK